MVWPKLRLLRSDDSSMSCSTMYCFMSRLLVIMLIRRLRHGLIHSSPFSSVINGSFMDSKYSSIGNESSMLVSVVDEIRACFIISAYPDRNCCGGRVAKNGG